MVVQIDGDRMLFQAITPAEKLLDCGILYRTADAKAKSLDKDTQKWMDSCESANRAITASRPE